MATRIERRSYEFGAVMRRWDTGNARRLRDTEKIQRGLHDLDAARRIIEADLEGYNARAQWRLRELQRARSVLQGRASAAANGEP